MWICHYTVTRFVEIFIKDRKLVDVFDREFRCVNFNVT